MKIKDLKPGMTVALREGSKMNLRPAPKVVLDVHKELSRVGSPTDYKVDVLDAEGNPTGETVVIDAVSVRAARGRVLLGSRMIWREGDGWYVSSAAPGMIEGLYETVNAEREEAREREAQARAEKAARQRKREAQEKDFMARLEAQGVTVRQTYRSDAPLGMTLKDAEALLERLEGQA